MNYAVIPATHDDISFARDLTQSNMRSYYTSLGLEWDNFIYENSWPTTENYRLELDGFRIGILRLSASEDIVYIRDLQILPTYQNRGAGSFAVAFTESLAGERNFSKIGLRVFLVNPAKHLYNRLGFQEIFNEGKTCFLLKRLTEH